MTGGFSHKLACKHSMNEMILQAAGYDGGVMMGYDAKEPWNIHGDDAALFLITFSNVMNNWASLGFLFEQHVEGL